MLILDNMQICSDLHPRIYFIRIEPDDIESTLSDIFVSLSNLSWVNQFDEDFIQESFIERAKSTIEDIRSKIENNKPDKLSSDAGEYIVSELAREVIVSEFDYLDIPLAELYNKKKSGNPGFDFHSQTTDEVIIFGEAKFLSGKNAYGSGFKQVVNFISNKKDIKDIVDLRDFCSNKALSNANNGIKGFAVAFSATSMQTDQLILNIIQNQNFITLMNFKEIIVVAVNL